MFAIGIGPASNRRPDFLSQNPNPARSRRMAVEFCGGRLLRQSPILIPRFPQPERTTAMDKDSVIFVVLNLGISAFVPLISVYAAQCLGRRDAKRQQAGQLFTDIILHTQDFRWHLIGFWDERRGPAINPSRREITSREFFVAHIALDRDTRRLRFLFGERAEPLIKALDDMLGTCESYSMDKAPPENELGERLYKLSLRVDTEIDSLWGSVVRPSAGFSLRSFFVPKPTPKKSEAALSQPAPASTNPARQPPKYNAT
jgi:hypothetical protein